MLPPPLANLGLGDRIPPRGVVDFSIGEQVAVAAS